MEIIDDGKSTTFNDGNNDSQTLLVWSLLVCFYSVVGTFKLYIFSMILKQSIYCFRIQRVLNLGEKRAETMFYVSSEISRTYDDPEPKKLPRSFISYQLLATALSPAAN